MENNYHQIQIDYSFSSTVDCREEFHLVTHYKAKIYLGVHCYNSHNEYAGEVIFRIINIRQAQAEGFDIASIVDDNELAFGFGDKFYNFRKGNLRKPLFREFPKLEFGWNNICIIESIKILPEFRGEGIGPRVFKDIVWCFDHCELFILKPTPLQFAKKYYEDYRPNYFLGGFSFTDEKTSTAKLTKYFKTWGFKKLKDVKDLMFFSPLHTNEVFENIDIEDYY